MKKLVITWLMCLCMSGTLFAWEPENVAQVTARLEQEEQTLSEEQKSILAEGKVIFEKRSEKMQRSTSDELADQLYLLANYYDLVYGFDAQVGRLLGAWLAMQPVSVKDEPFLGVFANVCMGAAKQIQEQNLSEAEKLAKFARHLWADYDSFLE